MSPEAGAAEVDCARRRARLKAVAAAAGAAVPSTATVVVVVVDGNDDEDDDSFTTTTTTTVLYYSLLTHTHTLECPRKGEKKEGNHFLTTVSQQQQLSILLLWCTNRQKKSASFSPFFRVSVKLKRISRKHSHTEAESSAPPAAVHTKPKTECCFSAITENRGKSAAVCSKDWQSPPSFEETPASDWTR